MWREVYHEFRRWAKLSTRAPAAYKRTEVTVETDRVWIIRKSHATRGWCAECCREVDMVGLNEAAVLLGKGAPPLTPNPMLPGCEDGRGWHWFQAPDGSLLLCLDSVLRSK